MSFPEDGDGRTDAYTHSVEASGYGFQIEMKYRASRMGFRILEIPIRFPDRTVGESKMSSSIFTEALSLVWKLRFKDI